MIRFYFTLFSIICSSNLTGQQFTEVSFESGINHVFKHNSFIGGGAAFFDADNDGDEDLYVTSGSDIDHFYYNNGDGTFTNRNLEAGLFLTSEYYTTGVAFGDINKDGYNDIFVTTRGDDYSPFAKNFLFLNLKNGGFADIWSQIQPEDKAYSVGATMFDYNNDGFLDIYVFNYVEQAGFIYDDDTGEIIGYDHDCFANQLYENLGDSNFKKVGGEVLGNGCSLAVCATDIDQDDDIDLFVANDFGEFLFPNDLYQNNFPNTNFTNSATSYGVDQGIYGMGVSQSDFDLDGDLDYYVTNFGSNLLLQNENGSFNDISTEKGVDNTWFREDENLLSISWGTVMADFDNNRFPDLFVANGYVPSPNFINSALGQDDVYYSNQDGYFSEIENNGLSNKDVSRGVAYCDYDSDGDLDLFVVVQNVPVGQGGWHSKLYRNDSPILGNYLQVELEGLNTNTNGFGSTVKLYVEDQVYMQELVGASSHCSQNSSILHFGLDTVDKIDSVIVNWLGEFENDTIFNVAVNQRIKIIEDTNLIEIDTMIIDTISSSFNLTNPVADIKLFPNPGQNMICVLNNNNIAFENIKIVGVNTNLIFDLNLNNVNCFNISDLLPGVYFLHFKAGSNHFFKKFIKT